MLYPKNEKKIQYERFSEEEYLPFKHEGFHTKAIHHGQEPEPVHGSVNVPIHMSSTYAQRDIAEPFGKFDYTRGGNPTREALEKLIAGIEYGKYSVTFASGCGATAAILHTLKSGDHIVVCDDVYGGTQRYMRLFARDKFGLEVDFVDMTNLENLENVIRENTKLIWIETPTNPTLKIIDIQKTVEIAKKVGAFTVVDNTFATPFLQNPLLIGADVVYNSCTKYLGGHSDVVMGAIATNNEELYKKIYAASCSLGANPSPFDSFLMNRGIKTLPVRVSQATGTAYHLAHFLERHPNVDSVIYPGLKSHPQHEIAKKQMRGFGGMISFRIKGSKPEVSKFLKALKVFTLAESLGGVESLAQVPFFMTHASVPAETRDKLGITENLVRLSVGIESTDDLIEDVDQALKASQEESENTEEN